MFVSEEFSYQGQGPQPPHRFRRRLVLLAIGAGLLLVLVVLPIWLVHRASVADNTQLSMQPGAQTDGGQPIAGGTSSSSGKSSTSKSKTTSKGSTKTVKKTGQTSSGNTAASTSSNSTAGSSSGSTGTSSGGNSNTPITLHYTANIGTASSQLSLASSLGFNLFDTGPTKASIDALPSGVQALVWLGNLDNAPVGSACPAPGYSLSQFKSDVDTLANDSKVYGFYLSDEPHPSVCPSAASDIKVRADYVHAHAPSKKTFIVVLDGSNLCGNNLGCEYAALSPAHTDVDYIGLDPYPCHYQSNVTTPVPCDTSEISSRVNLAVSHGIPKNAIVPTFQTFGQAGRTDGKQIYYRMPTTSELATMLNTWHSLVPNPAFDYSYTFGVQCSSSSCPGSQAIANHPEIQAIIKAHNG